MDSHPWREQLCHKLYAQNLPPAYIGRLVEELSEHVLDTQLETMSMDAQNALIRLGNTDEIAAVAIHEFRRRAFAGRHPYLAFVVGPIALVPLLFLSLLFGPNCIVGTIDSVFTLVTGTALLPASTESSTLFPYWAAYGYHHFFRFVPFALAAAIFCHWGRSVGMQRWAMVASGIVAVMAGATASQVRPMDANSAEWMMMFGLVLKPSQLLQLLAPLVVAAGVLRWVPRRQSGIDSTSTQSAASTVE